MPLPEQAGVIRGFLFLKAVVHRHGTDLSARIFRTAELLEAEAVKMGTPISRREAIGLVEEALGYTRTVAMREEGATYATHNPVPPQAIPLGPIDG